MHIRGPPDTYRIALSTFPPTAQGVHSVVGDLTVKGFLSQQLCVVGQLPVIVPLASSTDPNSAIYCTLSQLATNVEAIHRSGAPIVASVGPISDVLLKKQSWLSSPATAPLNKHLANGDVVLAVNALDHDQFVHAARLLLRHGNGNLWTHIFRLPSIAAQD